jgi:transglutaminase-like putative cysteine protease
MNIPARYCTGYVVDSAAYDADSPVDFSPWFEAYLGGVWHAFDPHRRSGSSARVLMAAGRDAADVPIYTTFGPSELVGFRVFAALL